MLIHESFTIGEVENCTSSNPSESESHEQKEPCNQGNSRVSRGTFGSITEHQTKSEGVRREETYLQGGTKVHVHNVWEQYRGLFKQ